MCSYTTHISPVDKRNSSGKSLFVANDITTVANILRQDRANQYDIGSSDVADSNDEADCLFSTSIERERMLEMLGDGYISQQTMQAIINDTPDIKVDVFPTGIHVYLLE